MLMKKKLTKILSMLLVFAMVMCLVPPVEASAASRKPWFPKELALDYYDKNQSQNMTDWVFGNDSTNYKITELKSSDKNVLTVFKLYSGYTSLYMRVRKPGKATITFKVKVGNKTYSYKCKVTVHDYENPFKSLKIGKTNYASEFSYMDYYSLKGRKNLKGKLAITTNKNWKIERIEIYDNTSPSSKRVKNKKVITLKKGQTLWVTCRNKKTNAWAYATLSNEKW